MYFYCLCHFKRSEKSDNTSITIENAYVHRCFTTVISSSKALISFTVAKGSSKTSFDLFTKVWSA